jgi:hypothetical protein
LGRDNDHEELDHKRHKRTKGTEEILLCLCAFVAKPSNPLQQNACPTRRTFARSRACFIVKNASKFAGPHLRIFGTDPAIWISEARCFEFDNESGVRRYPIVLIEFARLFLAQVARLTQIVTGSVLGSVGVALQIGNVLICLAMILFGVDVIFINLPRA